MLKAKFDMADGRPGYLFGLTAKNIERLRQGMPIFVDLEPYGGVGRIIICYGQTESAIARQLSEFIGPETEIRGLPDFR